jgi:hypothetical protein
LPDLINLIRGRRYRLDPDQRRRILTNMGKPDDQPMRLFTALASTTVTAYALAYVAHFELGLSRLKIREDALAAVGLLVVVLTVKIVFRRKNNSGS